MSKSDRSFKVKLDNETVTIHLSFDWMPEPDERKFTWCVIETERHEFYSGVAVRHPKEPSDTKTGWKISLKRACEALDWIFGESIFKCLWHEIRLQLRQEKDAEQLKKIEEIKANIKAISEEENGQDAS